MDSIQVNHFQLQYGIMAEDFPGDLEVRFYTMEDILLKAEMSMCQKSEIRWHRQGFVDQGLWKSQFKIWE